MSRHFKKYLYLPISSTVIVGKPCSRLLQDKLSLCLLRLPACQHSSQRYNCSISRITDRGRVRTDSEVRGQQSG